ncbi:MAG TPA: hypothetical protein VM325_18665 [Alphaproteobacteria bacterium]|nr:hypothetical protein [Alphaproteobacteria bacterium]
MLKLRQALGLAAVLAVFAALLGYFTYRPSYVHFTDDQALIKISFTLGGKRLGKCIRRTRAQLQKLPPHMRKVLICPRERHPVHVEVLVDNQPRYQATVNAAGLSKDGSSKFYHGLVVAPGKHLIVARLVDSGRKTGFDFEIEKAFELTARQHLIIDFQRDRGGFIFR